MPATDQMRAPDQPSFYKRFAETPGAKEREAEERAAAELGLWALAEHHVPPDVREAGSRWKLESFITELWRSAFIAGFRAAKRAERASLTGNGSTITQENGDNGN